MRRVEHKLLIILSYDCCGQGHDLQSLKTAYRMIAKYVLKHLNILDNFVLPIVFHWDNQELSFM
jgi:hypothetical protein